MTVERRVFLGERVQLHLRADGLRTTATADDGTAPERTGATLLAEVDRDHAVRRGETVGVSIAADRWMPWFEEAA
jgi:hypothetical protein